MAPLQKCDVPSHHVIVQYVIQHCPLAETQPAVKLSALSSVDAFFAHYEMVVRTRNDSFQNYRVDKHEQKTTLVTPIPKKWVDLILVFCTLSSFFTQTYNNTNTRAQASLLSMMEMTELRILTRWLSGLPIDHNTNADTIVSQWIESLVVYKTFLYL